MRVNLSILRKCAKSAFQKLNAIARMMPGMSLKKRKTLVNGFFKSLFNYFPLV